MTSFIDGDQKPFVDRRSRTQDDENFQGAERRQFRDSYANNRPEVRELANAVDEYKMQNRRRFITYEELYDVIASLGYKKEA